MLIEVSLNVLLQEKKERSCDLMVTTPTGFKGQLTLPRSFILWYSLTWLSRTTMDRVLEARMSSPLKMKLKSPFVHRISVKSPRVESSLEESGL